MLDRMNFDDTMQTSSWGVIGNGESRILYFADPVFVVAPQEKEKPSIMSDLGSRFDIVELC